MRLSCPSCGFDNTFPDLNNGEDAYACTQCEGKIDVTRYQENVGDWQRRLLQLDRRNNLLFFREGRSSVRISDHTADSMYELLNFNRRGLKFDYAESRSSQTPRDVSSEDEISDQPSEPYVLMGDIRGDCTPVDLQRRLTALRRRTREWEEEQGLNVLFLVLGFLRWVDEESQVGMAPLILLPCRLDRQSPRDPFILSEDDDDLKVNDTLSVRLDEFGITLPEPALGESTPGEYLQSIRHLIQQRPDWEVVDEVFLATFSFSKMAMWRDIENIRINGTDHAIVRQLAGGSLDQSVMASAGTAPESELLDLTAGGLDDLLDPRDQFTVLNADYSQLLTIRAARTGNNLVVHGPPGTGKSQTITNIISTLLAEGKTTLFVSEKRAALEQVKRRLDQRELGVFCLDMHSEFASKSNVYEQLQQSISAPRTVRSQTFDYASLTERRQRLNQIVRALHKERFPFGRSVYQVQGQYACLQDIAHVDFGYENIALLDENRLAQILEVSGRISLREREFNEHWSSHWHALKGGTPSLALANNIRQDMENLSDLVQKITRASIDIAGQVGIPPALSMNGFLSNKSLVEHFTEAPGVTRAWILGADVSSLIQMAELERDAQITRNSSKQLLMAAFQGKVPDMEYSRILAECEVNPAEERLLRSLLGETWGTLLLRGEKTTSNELKSLRTAIMDLTDVDREAANLLHRRSPENWRESEAQEQLLSIVGEIGPVPTRWVELSGLDSVSRIIEESKSNSDALDIAEHQVFDGYEVGVIDIIDRQMLIRYRTDYQSGFKRFFSSKYRADRKQIQAFRKSVHKTTFEEESDIVERVSHLEHQSEIWSKSSQELEEAIGNRFQARGTDWDSVHRDIRSLKEFISINPSGPRVGSLNEVLSKLITSKEMAESCYEFFGKIQSSRIHLSHLVNKHLHASRASEIYGGDQSWADLSESLETSIEVCQRIETGAEEPRLHAKDQIYDVNRLNELLDTGSRLVRMESEHHAVTDKLSEVYEDRYEGLDTDWAAILSALQWTSKLSDQFSSQLFSEEFLRHIESPLERSFYENLSKQIDDAILIFRQGTQLVSQSYHVEQTSFGQWEGANFTDIDDWAQDLFGDADFAGDWLNYQNAAADLDRVVGPGTTESIRQETSDSVLVSDIIHRRILGLWLDLVYIEEPLLGSFDSSEQNDLRDRFKEIDERHVDAAQDEVRRRVFEKYPSPSITGGSGELGILRGQLTRRRGQMPVRRLLRRIPNLVQALKPCFMMSPLAVSQYLAFSENDAETVKFDAVIFDEASQVFPEDSIPSILRGSQLILAGDQKQLPPSSFWRRSENEDDGAVDDEDDDEIINPMAGRESILDVAVGMAGGLFGESHLNVHYRSRDESLIQFSNENFYTEQRMITFPSSGGRNAWEGLHDVYVSDGVYDRARSRTNQIEAERVVDLVFAHMHNRPATDSLGVVAFSRTQADLIERLIEERRIVDQSVDTRFRSALQEPFFVKNLENVQGDERDRIIISVGYGPTRASLQDGSRPPNNFGPINQEGGARRLNVLITRARQRVDLVHSIRADEITSQQAGPKLLRSYLEFVSNSRVEFEHEEDEDRDVVQIGLFEDAVRDALIGRGYRVESGVGTSEEKIDLAILSEDGEKYDLGIRCDGDGYRNAQTARDREWLKPQVLNELGWSLHWVWSTAWLRNPELELDKIEEALMTARSTPAAEPLTPPPDVPDPLPGSVPILGMSSDNELKEEVATVETEQHQPIVLEEYVKAEIGKRPSWAELRSETRDVLVGMILRVVNFEGPVHKDEVIDRIREVYGLGHVSGSTRERVDQAVRYCQSQGSVTDTDSFLCSDPEQRERPPRFLPSENIERYSPWELKKVIVYVVRVSFGIERKELINEVSRGVLGFKRTGTRINQVIDKMIQELIDDGILVESIGIIRVEDSGH